MKAKTIKFYTLSEQELEKVVGAVVKAAMRDVPTAMGEDLIPPPAPIISAYTKQALRDLEKS